MAGRSPRKTIRAACSTACSARDRTSLKAEHEKLQRRIKLVDAVAESARSLDQQLGKTDRERMDQYMTSLDEVESRLIASERWIDIPLKKQDYSHLNLDITNEGDPAEYYRNMFDLMALAFDADITRVDHVHAQPRRRHGHQRYVPAQAGAIEDAPQSFARHRQGRPTAVRQVRSVPEPADRAFPGDA